jgi:hypothetical protein
LTAADGLDPVTADAVRQAFQAAEPRWTDLGWQRDGEAIANLLGDAVRQAFQTASPRLNAPSQRDCEALALGFICYRRDLDDFIKASGPFRSKWDRVDKVVAQLVAVQPELAELAEFAVTREMEHAALLTALLKVARRAAARWRVERKAYHRSLGWQATANFIAFLALRRWREANPRRRIGNPLSADQPATRLMVQLLRLAGYGDVTPERVAKHFARDQSSLPPIDP